MLGRSKLLRLRAEVEMRCELVYIKASFQCLFMNDETCLGKTDDNGNKDGKNILQSDGLISEVGEVLGWVSLNRPLNSNGGIREYHGDYAEIRGQITQTC